ncbi:MAG: hypothetical protein LBJ25_01335 [Candidatus Margulisbacteria bacterium]|nr:hypothetical protein [Candidatus Margulisiibacteriota bacterium]
MTRILQPKIAKGEPMLADDILHLTFFPIGAILMYDGNSWADNVTLKGWYRCDAANAAAGLTPDLTDKFIMGAAVKGSAGGSNSLTLTTSNLPAHSHQLSGLSADMASGHTHSYSGSSGGGTTHAHGLSAVSVSDEYHSHTFTGTAASGYIPIGDAAELTSVGGMGDVFSSQAGITWGLTTGGNGRGIKFSMTPSGTIDSVGHKHTLAGDTAGEGSHTHYYSGTTGGDGAHTHNISGGSVGDTGSGTAFDNRPSYYTLIYIRKCA